MAELTWNDPGERLFETGVDRGVLYPIGSTGVAWNGLISVTQDVSGGEAEALYYDGEKYLDLIAGEDFSATLEAFSSPVEFASCDGQKTLAAGLYATGQPRTTFNLSYRSLVGNDLVGTDYAYKLHLIYNATASPTTKSTRTISKVSTPETRSWSINTVPDHSAQTYKPTAHLCVDSSKVSPTIMSDLEDLLYGTASTNPTMPPQAAVIALLGG